MPLRHLTTALLLLAATRALAQPPDGSMLWLRSDAGVTALGDSVLLWEDQSGFGNSVAQMTAANRPHFVTNAIDGLPAIRFNGSTNYMEGPNVFPMRSDYTLSLVVKIANFAATNNIVSGTTHAHWLGNARYPRVLHGNFNTQEVSSVALGDSAAVITFVYTEGSKNAIVYVNGLYGDSAFVGTNTDSTLFIGAFQRGNLLSGDLAEVILYPKRLSATERASVESYFFTKYAIAKPAQPPAQDSTFTEHPSRLQLYPRNERNIAEVRILGSIHQPGFDSIYTLAFKNNVLTFRYAEPLDYYKGAAPFGYARDIQAELAEYKFVVGIKRPGKDTVLATWDSIVCGDVYLVCGQSNSIFGVAGMPGGEFCRTFGVNFSQNRADTTWGLSDGTTTGGGRSVGGWAMRLQKAIQDSLHIPTCVISGGVGGTTIEQHQRDSVNPMNLATIYGSMLYRVDKAGVRNAAKAMLWYQGESNQMTPADATYPSKFRAVYDAWNQDYPNLQLFVITQIHPGCAGGPHKLLREFQRECGDSLPHTTIMSVMGVPGHDGCHFNLLGYTTIGDNMFRIVRHRFYPVVDTTTANILPPNIQRAFYTSSTHDTVALLFRERNAGIEWPEDTLVGNVSHMMSEAFYFDTLSLRVETGWVSGDTVFLKLLAPLARRRFRICQIRTTRGRRRFTKVRGCGMRTGLERCRSQISHSPSGLRLLRCTNHGRPDVPY